MKTITTKDVLKLLVFVFILLTQKMFSQCPTPPGDQTTYGSNSWIGYVYNAVNTSNPPTNAFTTTYRGYITQPDIFDMDLGSGSISGANLCGTYADQFSIRFKMTKNFPAGNYSFVVGGDDGYRLSIDGGATWLINNWSDRSYVTATSSSVYLSGNVNLVIEYYEQGGLSRVSFSYANCANPSTAPTGISGNTTVCAGTSTTLTATGGTLAFGATYQWGTGTVVGSNIIAGQTGSSITVTPSSTTTYWVRYVDPAPCAAFSAGVTQSVNVITASSAPTSITGTTTICLGNSTTLTATGGTLGTNGTYEWGTGYTAGINTIAGVTSATLTVNPTTTTGYWVRRVDSSPCPAATAIISTTVNVNTPAGDQTTYGSATWIGYVYSGLNSTNPPSNIATAPYRGYITQPEIFDYDLTSGAISGGNLCGTYTDQFFVRYKMTKNLTAGYYTFTVGGDDGYRLSVDGGSTYIINNFVDHSYTSSTSATVYLNGNTNFILEYYEQTGSSRVNFNYTSCTNFSTAPTGVTGSMSLCYGAGGTTLTATGGYAAPGATYQWGTGSVVGTNPIAGATYNGYYINPSATTTYWVRRVDGSPCNISTGGYVFTVTVATQSTQPTTITPSNPTVCSGSAVTLTASGGTLGSNGVYEWGAGYSAGVNTIAGQSGASITINPTSTSGYWVRRVDSAPCSTATGHITTTVTVTTASTAPTSITGGGTSCSGTSYTLTATGGTAAPGATYQWGTGSVVGTNPIAGTGVSITVSPTTTTTYWVRRYDATCTSYTSGVTTTITITTPPGNPATFGNNVWNAYGYSTGDITLATAVYAGYYSVNTINFDTQSGTNSWNSTTSPSSSAGWSGCSVPNDNFTFVAKRKGFPCGTYTIAMQNWDDAAQLYLNGTLIWSNTTWSGTGNYNVVVGSYNLDSNSEVEVRIRENTGNANVSLTLTNTNVASTAPTGISGTTTICGTGSTTLTASGGTLGTTGSYEWGTGNVVGSNVISGQTSSAITVSPTSDTTYWVRRKDTVCGNTTSGISQLVSVFANTVAGTLSTSATTICRNTTPGAITLSGNTGNVIKWQYANDAAFTSGVTDITNTTVTLSSAEIGSLSGTRYFRAVVQNGSCNIAYTAALGIVVPATVTYNNGSWSGTPTSTTPVVISSNITLGSSLNVCSCQVTGSAVVTVPANVSLVVQNDISVASTANIVVENNGSLVQVNNGASNIGNITFKRNSTPLKQYDYTYWSSPLVNQTLNVLASPSLFYSFNPTTNSWAGATSSTVMTAAKGYISRVPNNLNFSTPQVITATFNGVPNNGVITTPIVKGSGTFNLIGNPYPSAIDIDAFLLDSANTGVVNGTIYLWTHNTAIANVAGTGMYNYTRDDYAKYNITGGVKTASAAITGGAEPTGKVAAGQGFFIEANSSLAAGTYSATFNNSMRIANNNNQFFKINPSTGGHEPIAGVSSAIQKNRVWLNISNTTGAYDEALVGYITGATNGFDNLYDGKTFPAGNVVSIYSIMDTTNYSIQGRSLPFREDDVVPLGITTTISGDFSINLERFDGLFQNQNVYLLDKLNGVYHNLKSGGYNFTITSGSYNDRFELRFSNETLGTNNPTISENDVKIMKVEKHIEISADNFIIDNAQLFDLLGKALYRSKGTNSNTFKTSDLNIATQIIIVKVMLDNGQSVTKKILFNRE